jgi:hypothetical protein
MFHGFCLQQFNCPYASKLWTWLASILNVNLHCNSIENLWKIEKKFTNAQCQVVVTAGIINVLNAIWHSRKQERFQDKHFSWQMAINMVVSNVSLTGNKTKRAAAINMAEFELLKAFKIQIHPMKPPLDQRNTLAAPLFELDQSKYRWGHD